MPPRPTAVRPSSEPPPALSTTNGRRQRTPPPRRPSHLALLGPPGAGKGTQGRRLADRLGLVHLGVGQLLRDEVSATSAWGEVAAPYLERGLLVPDAVVTAVLRGPLTAADRGDGYVLDGYPRTVAQARTMEEDFGPAGYLDLVVVLEAPDGELASRLAQRSTEDRHDDLAEVRAARLAHDRREAPTVVAHYDASDRLARIDANQAVGTVTDNIVGALADRGLVRRRPLP